MARNWPRLKTLAGCNFCWIWRGEEAMGMAMGGRDMYVLCDVCLFEMVREGGVGLGGAIL